MKRTKHIPLAVVAFFILLLSTELAHANTASFFTMKTALQLLVGNAILGFIEGLIIAKVFKISKIRSVLFLIPANYFSAWVGFLGLLWLSSIFEVSLSRIVTINNIYRFVWLLLFVGWLMTIFLEYPFCLFTLWRKKKRLRQALNASLIVQTCSHIVLLIFISPFGHFTGDPFGRYDLSFVPVKTFAENQNATIYFISGSEDDLYRIKPDGSSKEKVETLGIRDKEIHLVARNSPDPDSFRLYVQKRPSWKQDAPHPLIDTGIDISGFTRSSDPNEQHGWLDVPALDLRPDSPDNLRISSGGYGNTWLTVRKPHKPNVYSDRLVSLQFDNRFLRWISCSPTVLPGNQVVYQLGNQIVLLDVNQQKLGLITLGRAPVVFLDKEPEDGFH